MRQFIKVFAMLTVTLLSTQLCAHTTYKQVQIHTDNLIENKQITLPIVKLSQADKALLQQRLHAIIETPQQTPTLDKSQQTHDSYTNKPSRYDKTIDLTMNGIPKLDQGAHGTCSTFATTALLDASVYQSDYISQLCLLALGTDLERKDPQVASGWDGNNLDRVIERIERYGVIDKSQESTLRCGGFVSYPIATSGTGTGISTEEYTAHSQPLPAQVEIVNIKQNSYKQLIENIKEELELGNRIYLSVYIDPESYNAGFIDNHNTYYYGDTLVVTENLMLRILNDELDALGRHGMVIYGYDDSAVQHGQKGIFFLRNSWGESFGFYGDGYITYDYLKLMFRYAKAVRVKTN